MISDGNLIDLNFGFDFQLLGESREVDGHVGRGRAVRLLLGHGCHGQDERRTTIRKNSVERQNVRNLDSRGVEVEIFETCGVFEDSAIVVGLTAVDVGTARFGFESRQQSDFDGVVGSGVVRRRRVEKSSRRFFVDSDAIGDGDADNAATFDESDDAMRQKSSWRRNSRQFPTFDLIMTKTVSFNDEAFMT